MFSKQELKELAAYRSERPPVLSVYLNVDTTQLTAEQYRLTLKGMLKSVASAADRADIQAVEEYLDLEYDWQGNGIAMFAAGDFFRMYPLALSVGDHVRVGPEPYIKPLADYADAYDRYGVALVDREGARLFLFNQGALQGATGMLGQELKESTHDAAGRGGRSGRGGGQGFASSLEGRIDQVASQNLREVVEITKRFYQAGRCERIILGGTDENRARFLGMLPKTLQSKVIGDFSIDMYASPTEVLEKSMGIIQASVSERKAALVRNVITASHKSIGSVGLADTLTAMQEQRVQTLVLLEGFQASGHLCTHCGFLTLSEVQECPVCDGGTQLVADIVDHMVHLAIQMDVEVAFVQDEALEKVGSVGALWRF